MFQTQLPDSLTSHAIHTYQPMLDKINNIQAWPAGEHQLNSTDGPKSVVSAVSVKTQSPVSSLKRKQVATVLAGRLPKRRRTPEYSPYIHIMKS